MTLPERFAKLAGIEWHEVFWKDMGVMKVKYCTCGHKYSMGEDEHIKPTFSHPEEVLEVMMKSDDWSEFSLVVGCWYEHPKSVRYFYIRYDYITTPNKLLQAAVDFMEAK